MKARLTLLPAIALGLVMALAAPQASAAETIVWKIQSLFPAGTSDYAVFRDYFVPLVEKMIGEAIAGTFIRHRGRI